MNKRKRRFDEYNDVLDRMEKLICSLQKELESCRESSRRLENVRQTLAKYLKLHDAFLNESGRRGEYESWLKGLLREAGA